jgi:hypothetical protein
MGGWVITVGDALSRLRGYRIACATLERAACTQLGAGPSCSWRAGAPRAAPRRPLPAGLGALFHAVRAGACGCA